MLLCRDNCCKPLLHFPLVSILDTQSTIIGVWGEGSYGPSQITVKRKREPEPITGGTFNNENILKYLLCYSCSYINMYCYSIS